MPLRFRSTSCKIKYSDFIPAASTGIYSYLQMGPGRILAAFQPDGDFSLQKHMFTGVPCSAASSGLNITVCSVEITISNL